jgi:hypothetical protein
MLNPNKRANAAVRHLLFIRKCQIVFQYAIEHLGIAAKGPGREQIILRGKNRRILNGCLKAFSRFHPQLRVIRIISRNQLLDFIKDCPGIETAKLRF